ncbi:hypothetical protein ANO11243_074670 [Dothideomycetidae sp. 11243]|nr:hypothetical protein ANO11243_074670 [fungal sp. No.11243]
MAREGLDDGGVVRREQRTAGIRNAGRCFPRSRMQRGGLRFCGLRFCGLRFAVCGLRIAEQGGWKKADDEANEMSAPCLTRQRTPSGASGAAWRRTPGLRRATSHKSDDTRTGNRSTAPTSAVEREPRWP